MAETAKIADLKLGDVISANLYGAGVNQNLSNVTITGFISGIALVNPQAAAVNHANIYSSLPNVPGNVTPDNYTRYNYIVVKSIDGSKREVGIPWINPSTLSRLVRQTATVTITDFDISQLQILQDMLTVNGYLNATITVV